MTSNLFDDEIEKEAGVWYAPTIQPKELWRPLIVELLRIIRQPDMDRPFNLCIHGNTLVGKTTFIKAVIPDLIAFELRKQVQLISETFGINRITCDTNTTIKGIYRANLTKLTWPYRDVANTQMLERTLGQAVRERQCRLLMIDEFSQVLSHVDEHRNSTHENEREELILKALRNIPTHTLRPIVIIGTDKILNLLAKDVETKSRFKIAEFPRFKLVNGQWRVLQNFIATLDHKLYESTGIRSNFNKETFILEEL